MPSNTHHSSRDVLVFFVLMAVFMTTMTIVVIAVTVNAHINFLDAKATVVSAYRDTDGSLHPVFQFINSRTGMQVTATGWNFWVGEGERFRVGDEVSILYDPINPYVPNSIKEDSFLSMTAIPIIMVLCSFATWFLVYMGVRPLKAPRQRDQEQRHSQSIQLHEDGTRGHQNSEHHVRYSRAPNFVIIGVACLFVVPILMLLFHIALTSSSTVALWTMPFFAILCCFVILALYITTRPRRVLPDV